MTESKSRAAKIEVLDDGVQKSLRVTVPRGTTLAQTVKLHPLISEITAKLQRVPGACDACNSGIPIWFVEEDMFRDVIRVDLESLQIIRG